MVQDNNQLLLDLLKNKLSSESWKIKDQEFFYSGSLKVTDLSKAFRIPADQIIAFFWDRGKTVNQNQNLPFELINNYCQSRRIKKVIKQKESSFNSIVEEYLCQISQKENLVPRPPIVSVMGHIDHGKTTLLDTICHSQVQKKEKGGITQKISIHQINFQEQKITFLDTPGHQIFFEMRQRGINLTDLVILVIAADDGVMPQTAEIIKYVQQNKILTIVFLNHKTPLTDNETNLTKLKSQLQEQQLTPIEWGGDTLVISGSAKSKKSTDYLCENILLMSEINEWKTDPNSPAYGVVIDSKLSPQLGKTNFLLVQGGVLKEGNLLFINGQIGKVKRMTDLQGKSLNQTFPSASVQVIGLDFLAEAGEKFLTITNKDLGKKISKLLENYRKEKGNDDFSYQPSLWLNNDQKKNINLLVISDTQASLETLTNLVQNKSTDDLHLQLIDGWIGNISDQIIKLAKITHSYLLIFNLELGKEVRQNLKENQIKYFVSDIIYEVEEKLTELIQRSQEKKQVEKTLGIAEVKQIFYFSKGNIAGCQVIDGTVDRSNLVYVSRQGQRIFSGKIKGLESENVKINEVRRGKECGIVLEGFDDFQEKDQIISYHLKEENVS